MGNNTPARAISSPELIYLGSPGQSSKQKLAIQTPNIVYRARVNQTFDSVNQVVQLEYDAGVGTLADVLPGMVAFISDSGFGGYEKGIARIRTTPDGTYIYIGEVSDIAFSDNDYITIVDIMPPLPRFPYQAGETIRMDYDVNYSYNANKPMAVLGPIAAVLDLELDSSGNYIPQDFTPVDPSESFSAFGATIDSYLFDCPGAASTAGLDTTNPTFTFDTPGIYLWSCTITDSNGVSQTGYRWVFVNPSAPLCNIGDIEGDSVSGFSVQIEMFGDVDITEVYPRSMVVLYEMSYYGQVPETLGPIEGYENIRFIGWIGDESIERDPSQGVVRFRVYSPEYWLQQIPQPPVFLMDSNATSTDWDHVYQLTIDKALSLLLIWRTTASQIMDFKFTGNETRTQLVSSGGANLWDHLYNIAGGYLFAAPICNQFGQIFIEIDSNVIPFDDRDSLPVVMDIQSADMVRGSLRFEISRFSKRARVELIGVGPFDGTNTATQIGSRAPGTTFKHYGGIDAPVSSYIFDDQAHANFISGQLLEMANREYSGVSFILAHNNPFISMAPRQYIRMSLSAGDTPRGVSFTNARLIPRSISRRRNKATGEIQTALSCEFEARGTDGVDYVPPSPQFDNFSYPIGSIGSVSIPDIDTSFPDFTGPAVSNPCAGALLNNFNVKFSPSYLDGGDSTKLIAEIFMPCTIRTGNQTTIKINGLWFGDAANHYAVYGIKNGNIAATAAVTTFSAYSGNSYNVATFNPLSNTVVDGFRIVLESGLGSSVAYSPLDVIQTGSLSATDSVGSLLNTEDGLLYSVEGVGGPWNGNVFAGWTNNYGICIGGAGGKDGWVGFDQGAGNIFRLNTPSRGVYSEAVDSFRGRVYFWGGVDAVYAACGFDSNYGDNSGSFGFALRNASARGRRIDLRDAVISNICAAS